MRVVLGAACSLAVPVFSRTSYIDRFVKGIFLPERKIVPYDSKPKLILAMQGIPEEQRDKAKDITVMEEDAPRLMRPARQT